MSLTWTFIFESSNTATLEGMRGCRPPYFSRLYTLHRNKTAHPLTWLLAYRHLSMIASWLNSRLIKAINNNSMGRKHKYHIHRLMQQRRNPNVLELHPFSSGHCEKTSLPMHFYLIHMTNIKHLPDLPGGSNRNCHVTSRHAMDLSLTGTWWSWSYWRLLQEDVYSVTVP